MQTVMTADKGTVTASRTLAGIDLDVKNPEGETIATVVMSEAEAWALFQSFGEELHA
jgi:hypothetical protein